jgi:hypothetical protein
MYSKYLAVNTILQMLVMQFFVSNATSKIILHFVHMTGIFSACVFVIIELINSNVGRHNAEGMTILVDAASGVALCMTHESLWHRLRRDDVATLMLAVSAIRELVKTWNWQPLKHLDDLAKSSVLV